MLKSRSMWPPQGWRFRQPETGWSAPGGQTFSQVVEAIISHRQQNPRFKLSTDRATVENELDDYTCAILKNDQHWCEKPTVASFSVPLPMRPQLEEAKQRSVVGGVKRFIENATAGIKVWMNWFGDGRPVERSLTEQRATVCLACPLNEKANIAERFTEAAAKEILSIFASLNELDLHTSREPELHICKACSCPLRAKIWAPLRIIKKHITKEAWAALDSKCWMLSEKE